MKLVYEELSMDILSFSAQDVITTSGGDNETPDQDPFG